MEVAEAARRILGGDDSMAAAAALEGALLAHHPYADEFEDLLEALAMYAPSLGPPYVGYPGLCEELRRSVIFAPDQAEF